MPAQSDRQDEFAECPRLPEAVTVIGVVAPCI
jgi:hypothetical protein